jgi:hypothetical protein
MVVTSTVVVTHPYGFQCGSFISIFVTSSGCIRYVITGMVVTGMVVSGLVVTCLVVTGMIGSIFGCHQEFRNYIVFRQQ